MIIRLPVDMKGSEPQKKDLLVTCEGVSPHACVTGQGVRLR